MSKSKSRPNHDYVFVFMGSLAVVLFVYILFSCIAEMSPHPKTETYGKLPDYICPSLTPCPTQVPYQSSLTGLVANAPVLKQGNNGTVSCQTYCQGTYNNTASYPNCVIGFDNNSKQYIPCSKASAGNNWACYCSS